MTLDEFRSHCLKKAGYTENFPFDEVTLAMRVGNKIFALMDTDLFTSVNLKCDPERAIDLRERYPGITPGYHMNKQHWNTVMVDGSVPSKLLLELADHSYDLIRASLPKKIRETLDSE